MLQGRTEREIVVMADKIDFFPSFVFKKETSLFITRHSIKPGAQQMTTVIDERVSNQCHLQRHS